MPVGTFFDVHCKMVVCCWFFTIHLEFKSIWLNNQKIHAASLRKQVKRKLSACVALQKYNAKTLGTQCVLRFFGRKKWLRRFELKMLLNYILCRQKRRGWLYSTFERLRRARKSNLQEIDIYGIRVKMNFIQKRVIAVAHILQREVKWNKKSLDEEMDKKRN